MVDINNYIKTWASKLDIPEAEITSDYDKILLEETTKAPNLQLEELQLSALKRLHLVYKKQLRSPAVNFEGIIIGVSDVVDIVKKQRDEAIKQFKDNPQQAVELNLVNETGVPLDNKQFWNNGKENLGYGKPLPEHNFIRNVWGIATKAKSKSEPKFFSMTIMGNLAEKDDIPMFVPVTFKAIDKTDITQNTITYTLNASQFTKFELSKTILPETEELINKYCEFMKVPITKLDEYHEQNKDNFNRLCIVVGDVSSLNLDVPPTRSSRLMILEDLSLSNLENLESKGLLCWTPLRCNLDFQEGSKVIVIGRTGRGKKRDEEGNMTEEPGDVTLNVYGVYALPKYKIDIVE